MNYCMENLYVRCVIFLFFISFGSFGQQKEYIAGRLFDSKTNEPVVFANIRIKDKKWKCFQFESLGTSVEVTASIFHSLSYFL